MNKQHYSKLCSLSVFLKVTFSSQGIRSFRQLADAF